MSERKIGIPGIGRAVDIGKSLADNALGLPLHFFESRLGRFDPIDIVTTDLDHLQKEVVHRMRNGGPSIEMIGIGLDEISPLLRHRETVIQFPKEGQYSDDQIRFTIHNRFFSFLKDRPSEAEILERTQEQLNREGRFHSHIAAYRGRLHIFVYHGKEEEGALTALTPDKTRMSFSLVNKPRDVKSWLDRFFDPLSGKELSGEQTRTSGPDFEVFQRVTNAHNEIVGSLIGYLHRGLNIPLIQNRLELLPILRR